MTQVPSRADLEHLVVVESPDLAVLLTEDEDARCLFASGAAESLFGWPAASLEGQPFLDRVLLEDAPSVARALARAREGELASATFRMECAGGSSRWCEVVLHRPQREGFVEGIVGVVHDMTARRELEAALTRQAETDPLTGAVNRTVFLDRLRHALSRLTRSELHVGVLYLDLDHFKAVNDSLGHHVGDRILTATVQRLQSFLRPPDTLARLGGDEFAILLEDLRSPEAATSLADRIASAARYPLAVGSEEVVCSVSVGVVVTDDPHAQVEELLERADRAMYRAKRHSTSGYEVFDDRLRAMALRRVATESLIRRALKEDRLVLEYQPVVRLADRAVVAAEALVRIRTDRDALVPPEAFLDVALETGLVRRIDAWVLRNAVLQAEVWRTWDDLPDGLPVHVNLTARQLGAPGFADELAALLAEHSLPLGAMSVEVTEQELERLSTTALDVLWSLKARGVRLVLDDFGVGPASLTALHSLPLEGVKLHRSLVAQVDRSERARTVVGALVRLCADLGLTVAAVGVETDSQLIALSELGCDLAQGFLLAGTTQAAGLLPPRRQRVGGAS